MSTPELTAVRLQKLEAAQGRTDSRLWWISLFLAILLLLNIRQFIHGQEVGRYVATPADAVGWALGDLATVPEADRPFQRYIWIPPWGDEKWVASLNFSINTAASHAKVIRLATPVANGWLMRCDMRQLAPQITQLQKLMTTWDSLALQDPFFHVPEATSKVSAAILAPHLREPEAIALTDLNLSSGGIYRADWMVFKMLSTLEGGQYYNFLQVPREVGKDQTQQAVFLASLSVFEGTTKQITGDQRSAIKESGVTGKPRRIDYFNGLFKGNPVSITHDIADEDVEVIQNPLLNLRFFQDRAREIIVTRPNGTHAFALFDAQGRLQDSVPDNIAVDTTIPSPHTKRLQAAISCIRCHGPFDGLQPFGNDVQSLLSDVDVFTDVVQPGETREQVIDELAGFYAGQLDIPTGLNNDAPIGRGRRDYSAVVYKIVGGAFGDAPSVVAAVSEHTSKIYGSYRYERVTAAKACAELGLLVDEQNGAAGINEVLGPRVPGLRVSFVEAELRKGGFVNRFDFDREYADLALTAERRRKEVVKK